MRHLIAIIILIAALCGLAAGADAQTDARKVVLFSRTTQPILNLNFTNMTVLPQNITFSRLSAANYFSSAGLLVSASSGQARFDYDPGTLAPQGLYVEESRTNVALWNRDLTNAAWTVSNATAAKDQTGIDGSANAASSVVATSGNATILQAITLASSARSQSAFVKRITGSGTINMTTDGGTTWVGLSASNCRYGNTASAIVSTNFVRCAIPSQTLANPSVGFRIVTNGDKIAVDFVQNENGTFATSPLASTSTTTTRAAEQAKMATTSFQLNRQSGTWVAEFMAPYGGNAAGRIIGSQGAWGPLILNGGFVVGGQTNVLNFDGTNSVSSGSSPGVVPGVVSKAASGYSASGLSVALNNNTIVTGSTVQFSDINAATTLGFGQGVGGSFAGSIYMRVAEYFNRRLANGGTQALTH